jgi:serine/threonine-protein kinase
VGVRNKKLLVKLADFGLARAYQQTRMSGLTLTGELGGSLPYVAPEQITNFREALPISDIYSVAATLYTLLTNHYIYELARSPGEQLARILCEDPVPIESRRSLPAGLAEAIHKGLSRNPQDRYQGAPQMRRALRPYGTARPA